MITEAFKKAYKNLNPAQKEAVDTIEGPVMVIAGPGTGKTSILTLRIANILKETDTPPSGILALTFTDSAVHAMRQKLLPLIGPAAHRVNIFTFHGFANEMIRKYSEYFPRIIGGTTASDVDKISVVEEEILNGDYEVIKPFGDGLFYVSSALRAISDLKRDNISPEEFTRVLSKEEKAIMQSEDLLHQKGRYKGEIKGAYKEALKNIEKNRELCRVYAAYEKALAEKRMFDYDDMLLEMVRAMKEEKDFLQTLQEEYLYILADEHQDANNSQNAILELLADYHQSPNLFIVGDEKQAIYRFQGASLENFLYFKKKFETAKVVFLDSNYRSTQTILDASHALMGSTGENKDVLRPRLTAGVKHSTEAPIELVEYNSSADEAHSTAMRIKELIADGLLPKEIAVLVRTNAEAKAFALTLSRMDLPYTLYTSDDVLEDEDMQKLIMLLSATASPQDEELMGKVFLIDFLGLHPMDAVLLLRLSREKRRHPLEVLMNDLSSVSLQKEKEAKHLARMMTDFMVRANNESLLSAFVYIVAESGFVKHLLSRSDSVEKLEKLSLVYDEVSRMSVSRRSARLADFVEALNTLKRHSAQVSFSGRAISDGVSVMTAHKSKGLEYDYVFMLNVADKVWGNRRAMSGFKLPLFSGEPAGDGRQEDERRLFYVALTRARKHVTISWPKTGEEGKPALASRFTDELPPELVARREGEVAEAFERMLHLAGTEKESRTLWDRKYLKKIFLEQGLNATALNNYLDCPWKFFFRNLVRIPDVPKKHQLYGTAIHAALKYLSDALKDDAMPSLENLLDRYAKQLHKLPLSEHELKEAGKKGAAILEDYYRERLSRWYKNAVAEYSVADAILHTEEGESILLRGRLDRVEFLDEKKVRVVDYKTGSPKTRNDILGATKSSNGDIKRQLNFYRLLLDLHSGGKYEMVEGVVDFVEKDKAGRFHAEAFVMSEVDAEEVKKETISAAGEIVSFSFWDKTCNDPKCEWCALRKTLL